MEHIVTVRLGPNERFKQRAFLSSMAGIGLIKISEEEITRFCNEEADLHPTGYENHIVLKDNTEYERFRYAMSAFFKDIPWTEDRASNMVNDDEKGGDK